MQNNVQYLYKSGMTPEQLADAVLDFFFQHEEPSLPIDPFAIMKRAGIVYQFMDFKRLEGIYIVPENNGDPAVVGININRPITRQRFTAAHELCHHIKDRTSETCMINDRSEIERYAENFAAALLMPRRLLLSKIQELSKREMQDASMDDVLKLSVEFGVSFRSCALRLLYKFHFPNTGRDVRKEIDQYKPDKQKRKIGVDIEDIHLLSQALDSYTFFFTIDESQFWLIFKNDFVFNENRMEGVRLDKQEVAEIITDIRMNGPDSEFCNERYEDIIQIIGHASIYDFLAGTKEKPTIYSLLTLNKMLFQYAPFPEEAGRTRTTNNLVLGTKFETTDYKDVPMALYHMSHYFDETIRRVDEFSNSEYIERAAKIHHRITQIHPFRDGNGRTSRALLNWMFKVKGFPPIYIHTEDKEKYYQALAIADEHREYKELMRVLMHELFRTMIRINKQ